MFSKSRFLGHRINKALRLVFFYCTLNGVSFTGVQEGLIERAEGSSSGHSLGFEPGVELSVYSTFILFHNNA